MNISISGAQCTGKTTLLNEIEENMPEGEFVLIKEVVRTIKSRWESQGKKFSFNRSGDFNSQMAVFEEHHRNVLYNRRSVITDRSSLDALVYSIYNYRHGEFSFQEYDQFEKVFEKTFLEYDAFIYMPIGLISMKADGIRDIDISFQEEIDRIYRKVADYYAIELIELPLDNRLSRVNTIISKIKNI